jgi:hypothetical protein
MEYRASIENLSASTINVPLSALRKMATEARKIGVLSAEDAVSLTKIPNIWQKGTRLGNWLPKKQAKELLTVPVAQR